MPYLFDHQWQQERQRLAFLEAAIDPWSVQNLHQIGIQEGWRSLEVGGGGGSIAEWLSRQVGPNGHVVATDVETKYLEAIDANNVEVRRHNIVTDPLERETYDLIHARAVLDHLPERDAVVNRLVAALRPGGWLTIEGGDFSTVRAVAGEATLFFEEAFGKMLQTGQSAGMDPTYGRQLGQIFRREGLVNVSLSGIVVEWDSGHALASLYRVTFQRLRDRAIDTGMITAEEFERLLKLMASPTFRAIGHTTFFARGRRRQAA